MSSLPEEFPPDPEKPGRDEDAARPHEPEPWPQPPVPPEARPTEDDPPANSGEGSVAEEERGADPAETTPGDGRAAADPYLLERADEERKEITAYSWSAQPQAPQFDSRQAPEFDSYQTPRFEYIERAINRPPRIPHLGHLLLLGLLLLVGIAADFVAVPIALHFHLWGTTNAQDAMTEIHYTLGSEAILYLITFAGCVLVFPLLWHKGFLEGISWHFETAKRLSTYLVGAAFVCFLLALVNGWLMPGPQNAPIDKMFRVPGAAWLLFGFGITIAPFFEEMVFRGFLLPALCTACDWIGERIRNEPSRELAADGLPRWSVPAMVIGSILTSLPFAGMHAAQTGYSLGPFLLLIGVSLVLCAARLYTRSLAASVVIHACYNFMLFALMLFGTGGFRHLENM
jgi:uncharacterized protein